MGLLWSDRSEQQARSSLRQTLTELRKALTNLDPPILVAKRDTAQIDPDTVLVDAVAFEDLTDNGTPTALERAVELYEGDLLDGVVVHDPAYDDWLRAERQHLHVRACKALERLLEHHATEDTERAISTARLLLALDPLQEAVHRKLMRLYSDQGDRTSALKQYQTCRELLNAELGIETESETNTLADEIRTGAAPAPELLLPRAKPLELPDKPSVAVLPFTNLSGDPDQDYFADGITQDVITELGRFRSVFVIGSTSSFCYKGRMPKVQVVGRELGVAYVGQGGVRKAGSRVRITAQLIDAATGQQVWAERYDGELEDIFAVQDEVTGKIVSSLAGHLEDTGRRRAMAKRPEELAAYDYILLGEQGLRHHSMDGILRARMMFQRAIDLDPGSARAYSGLARSYIDEHWANWTAPENTSERAIELAKKAVALDELDGRARTNLAAAYFVSQSNNELALIQFDKALELNPNDASAYCTKGWCHVLSGQGEQAVACTDRAMRLNPFDVYDCHLAQFAAFYTAGRYEEAVIALGGIPDPGPEVSVFLAACYAQQGRDSEAGHAMADFLTAAPTDIPDYPGEDAQQWQRYWAWAFPFENRAHLDHLIDGFRKAGLPV